MKLNKQEKFNKDAIERLRLFFKKILQMNKHLKIVQLVVVNNKNENFGFTVTRRKAL